MYYEILMKNLNQILAERGISKMELAERADISVSFFSDLTNGKANPSLKIMEKLATSLNVSLPSLLSDYPVGAPKPVPKGFVEVSALLPEIKAFQVKRWQQEAEKNLSKID